MIYQFAWKVESFLVETNLQILVIDFAWYFVCLLLFENIFMIFIIVNDVIPISNHTHVLSFCSWGWWLGTLLRDNIKTENRLFYTEAKIKDNQNREEMRFTDLT